MEIKTIVLSGAEYDEYMQYINRKNSHLYTKATAAANAKVKRFTEDWLINLIIRLNEFTNSVIEAHKKRAFEREYNRVYQLEKDKLSRWPQTPPQERSST